MAAPAFEVIAVASSAGGLKALLRVLSPLPDDFEASIVVVQHLDPRHRSLMADLLVFTAPPNRHLLVNADGSLSLSQSELVHFLRPSADLLFESVAAGFRDRAIGVVLTGTGTDGSMGVRAIKKMGGTVIAQDEESSEFFGMPGSAIDTGIVDFILPLGEIAPALVTLVRSGEAW